MKITHTLIKKFLDDQCTAAEAEAVADHLQNHPDLITIYLQSSWDAAGKEGDVPEGYAAAMADAINAQVKKQMPVVRFRWLFAAASLLVAATAIWLFAPRTKNASQTLSKIEQTTVTPASWITETNTHAKIRTITLQDGSIVKLSPKATMQYQQPFGQQEQRAIYMEGEAGFDVAHDKEKPFIVHTKLFSTTALGTSFRVSETPTSCSVKLFNGKVLVKCLLSSLKGWDHDIILLPGNEMKYSAEGNVTIVPFNTMSKQSVYPVINDHPNKKEDAIVFNHTALSEVMKTLTATYHCSISCDDSLLNGKYFSGEVRKSDSLYLLLNVIANMNGLLVTKKENNYIVTQSK